MWDYSAGIGIKPALAREALHAGESGLLKRKKMRSHKMKGMAWAIPFIFIRPCRGEGRWRQLLFPAEDAALPVLPAEDVAPLSAVLPEAAAFCRPV